jgi:hypothetical protein
MNRTEACKIQSDRKPCYYRGIYKHLQNKPLYIKYVSPTHADIGLKADGFVCNTINLQRLMSEEQYRSKKSPTFRELFYAQKT